MSLSLLVLRHGKAEASIGAVPDRDRQLTPRGRADAERVGHFLRERSLIPGVILTSAAARASATAMAVADASLFSGHVEVLEELYQADPVEWLAALATTGGTAGNALIVGHNPAVEDLVSQCTGTTITVPTAGLAHIEFPAMQWADVSIDVVGKLRGFWRPSEFT